MKTHIQLTVMLLVVAFCCSCSNPSKEELAIADYTQRIDNTKMDLKFKIISMEIVGEVKAQDSIDYYLKEFKTFNDGKSLLDTLKMRYEERAKFIEEHPNPKGTYGRELIDRYKKHQPEFALIINHLQKLTADNNSILGKKIKCTYSIENPMLNNVKQEITRTFYLDASKYKVTATLD